MFTDTKKELEETKETLQVTKQDRDEQKYLVKEHVTNEKILYSEANEVTITIFLQLPLCKWHVHHSLFK